MTLTAEVPTLHKKTERTLKTLVLFFFVCPLYFGQPQPVTNTFKISGDNPSGNFLQKNPELFFNDSSSFIVTWDDFRTGPKTFMAAQLNGDGSSASNNFKISGREDFNFFGTNKFFVLSTYEFYIMETGYVNYYGAVQTAENVIATNISLGYATIPWCGTGWLGYSHSLIKKNDKFYFYLNNSGYIQHIILDSTGNTVSFMDDSISFAGSQAIASTNDNHSALFWFDVDFYTPDYSKIFGRFLDPSDNVIADSILISNFSFPLYIPLGMDNFFKVTATTNNNYLLYFATEDSFYYSLISNAGTILQPMEKVALKHAGNSNSYGLQNFSVSSTNDGTFDLFLTVRSRIGTEYKFNNHIISFTTSGNYLGITAEDTTFGGTLPKNIFKKGASNYFIPIELDKDIYLASLNNFVITPIRKITDDQPGSNENNGRVIVKDANSALVTWYDESNFNGRLIQPNGNFIGDAVILPSTDIRFKSDGTAFSFLLVNGKLVIHSLNQTLQVTQTDTLKIANQTETEIKGYYAYMPDANSLILLISKYDKAFLLSLDLSLAVSKKRDITFGFNNPNIRIYKRSENEFYVSIYNLIQIFDTQLNEVSAVNQLDVNEYIGNDVFVKVYYFYPNTTSNSGYFADFIKFDGTIVKQNLKLFDWGNNVYYSSIYEGVFGVSYTLNSIGLRLKSYNSNGTQLMSEFPLEQFTNISHLDFSFRRWNDNIIFTWTDNRAQNYDVWGKIFSVRSLVDAKDNKTLALNKFELMQNYPNPFNPSTKIKFTIPSLSLRERVSEGRVRVTLKVFDILGREVATLVDEEKPAGEYEVEFDASLLPSGIYFYRLQSGELVQEKKMILLK